MSVITTPRRYEEFGNRLKEKRKERKLSQGNLCSRVGVKSINTMSRYELGYSFPNDTILKKMADELNTTIEYLRDGYVAEPKKLVSSMDISKNEKPKYTNPVKQITHNEEGYSDPTAARAMSIVMNDKANAPQVGDVFKLDTTSNTRVLVLKVLGNNYLVTELKEDRPFATSSTYILPVLGTNGTKYYLNLSRIYSKTSFSLSSKVFSLSDITKNVVEKTLQKILFPVDESTAEPEADKISRIVADSVKYFNEKNGTSVAIPSGQIGLQQALDLAKELNVSMTELTRDHEEDRILDEICAYEEKIAALKAKIGI